jgi:iron-sulfur cluster insertion protein
MEPMTIAVSADAASKLRELQAGDPAKRALVRMYVAGRTCCSFQYGLAFTDAPEHTDALTEAAGIRIAIDHVSAPYCDGAQVEWVDTDEGSGFLVRNPSLSATCGCRGGER